MAKAYLGLGSNLGDKKEYIDQAVTFLSQREEITLKKISSYYETDPVGYTDQDVFLNIVVEIDTMLEPYELLAYCNEIEEMLQRKRIVRWGPRTIDVDILLFEGFSSTDERLTVPHPRMMERAFVMVPLYELEQNMIINDVKIEDIIKNLDIEGIRKVSYGR